MKKQILLVVSVLTTGAVVLGIACSDTPMEMPKNDTGTGTDSPMMQDNYVPPMEGGPPDAGNACDKGVVFDNKGRVPGWPNVPQP